MSSTSDEAKMPPRARVLKFALFVLLVVALVSVPFVVFGEGYALPLLQAQAHRRWALVGIAIALLTADSVAPVPSVIVIVGLAAKAGWLAGTIGGTIGLAGQVLCAAWFGRVAVGRVTPRLFSGAEVARLRNSLTARLVVTLACLRSVPVLAETSVMIAASLGIRLRRIFWATILPNFAISALYSLAGDDSFGTACLAFFATAVPSYVLWRCSSWLTPRPL